MLLAKGVDVNKSNYQEMTALMVASVGGHEEIVKLLLTKNPDINAKEWVGLTALDLAKEKGHANIIKLLEQYSEKEK